MASADLGSITDSSDAVIPPFYFHMHSLNIAGRAGQADGEPADAEAAQGVQRVEHHGLADRRHPGGVQVG